jgi:hypothetical protein
LSTIKSQFQESFLVAKDDINKLCGELKNDINKLWAGTNADINKLRNEPKAETIKWLFIFLIG